MKTLEKLQNEIKVLTHQNKQAIIESETNEILKEQRQMKMEIDFLNKTKKELMEIKKQKDQIL